jgi:hypothetical protein
LRGQGEPATVKVRDDDGPSTESRPKSLARSHLRRVYIENKVRLPMLSHLRDGVVAMCDRCKELDKKIEHYRQFMERVPDAQLAAGLTKLIQEAAAEKAGFTVSHSNKAASVWRPPNSLIFCEMSKMEQRRDFICSKLSPSPPIRHLSVTESVVLPPDVKGRHHGWFLRAIMFEVQNHNDAGADHSRRVRLRHPNIRVSRLRSRSLASDRACRSDEISGNSGLATRRTASANVRPSQVAASFISVDKDKG